MKTRTTNMIIMLLFVFLSSISLCLFQTEDSHATFITPSSTLVNAGNSITYTVPTRAYPPDVLEPLIRTRYYIEDGTTEFNSGISGSTPIVSNGADGSDEEFTITYNNEGVYTPFLTGNYSGYSMHYNPGGCSTPWEGGCSSSWYYGDPFDIDVTDVGDQIGVVPSDFIITESPLLSGPIITEVGAETVFSLSLWNVPSYSSEFPDNTSYDLRSGTAYFDFGTPEISVMMDTLETSSLLDFTGVYLTEGTYNVRATGVVQAQERFYNPGGCSTPWEGGCSSSYYYGDTFDLNFEAKQTVLVVAQTQNSDIAPVPEPSTFLLLGGGLAGLAFYARRRKKE